MQIGFNNMLAVLIFVLTFVIAGVGWWVNQMWNMLKAQQQLLGLIQVELAKNYVPRMELQETFRGIHAKLDAIPKEFRTIIQDTLYVSHYKEKGSHDGGS